MKFNYRHFFVDGNYVICHLYAIRQSGDPGLKVFDIFRFDEEEKFVEHWDAAVEVPPAAEVDHGKSLS